MRRSFVTLGFLACFQLLTPAPAHAFVRYLWELSGPGPFLGPTFQWRLFCIGDRDPARSFDTPQLRVAAVAAGVLGSSCVFQPELAPRVSFNLETGWLWSLNNHLNYAPGVSSKVRVAVFEPTMMFSLDPDRLRNSVELGFGAGVLIMKGPAFETFSRVFYEPIRIDVRPGAKYPGWRGAFSVRAAVTVITDGFDDIDFGALPGTFHQSTEVRPTFGVTIDVLRFFRGR